LTNVRTRILSAEIVCDRKKKPKSSGIGSSNRSRRDRPRETIPTGEQSLPEAYDSGDSKIVRVAMEVDEKNSGGTVLSGYLQVLGNSQAEDS